MFRGSNNAPTDLFGNAVAVRGDVAAIGAFGHDGVGANSGRAYIFRLQGTDWVEEQLLTASDSFNLDRFGNAVAIEEDTAFIASAFKVASRGAIYPFTYNGVTWAEQMQLTAADADFGDQFGFSMALLGDVLMVGALGNDDACPADPTCDSGSAYVFRKTGGIWGEEAKLTANDAERFDVFGFAIDVSEDLLIVGAPNDDDACPADPNCNSGSAYIFRRVAGAWVQEAKITGSNAAADDRFGASVAIDDDVAVVGSPRDDFAGNSSGSTYVFRHNAGVWTQEQELAASDAQPLDLFGGSLALRGDEIAVGAAFASGGLEPPNSVPTTGAVYLFRYVDPAEAAPWYQVQKEVASAGLSGEELGSPFASVAIDGDRILAGARRTDDVVDPNDDQEGAVHDFTIPDLALFMTPKNVPPPPNSFIDLDVCGGVKGMMGHMSISEVNCVDTFIFLPALSFTFLSGGFFSTTFQRPTMPDLTGISLTFQAISFDFTGKVILSNEEKLMFL
jgi:hypothetical protein